jgi:hypothetical protein
VKPDPTAAFLKKTLKMMEHGIFVDPIVFADKYMNKIRDSAFGGALKPRRSDDDWVRREDLDPSTRFKTQHDTEVKPFLVGCLRMLSMWEQSEVLRPRVKSALDFFVEVVMYPIGIESAKIRYVKEFMFKYADLMHVDWCRLMSEDQILMHKHILASGLRYADAQREIPMRDRAGDRGRLERNKRKRESSWPRERERKMGNSGFPKQRKFKCRSRTDVNVDPDGCAFESKGTGCRFSRNGGHECVSCGKDHTAGQCKKMGTWDQAKATAFLANR